MWHYTVVLIEKTVIYPSSWVTTGIEIIKQQPCYEIIVRFPSKATINVEDYNVFQGAEAWIEQNGVKDYKYAITKMYIKDGTN